MDDLIKYRLSSAKEKLNSAKVLLEAGCRRAIYKSNRNVDRYRRVYWAVKELILIKYGLKTQVQNGLVLFVASGGRITKASNWICEGYLTLR